MSPCQTFIETLRSQGFRITHQREMIVEAIAHSGNHINAEAVFAHIQERDHAVNIATVYRTLNVLKHMGLIEQRYPTRDHARENYEPVGAPEHYHFTCLACHQVIEFESPRVKQMQQELRHELNIEVSHACICLEGYCRACSAKRKAAQE